MAVFALDEFKELNDTYGHAAGDEVLDAFARRLSAHHRQGELVARLGGDEFAALLPETDAYSAFAFAERVRQSVLRDPLSALRDVEKQVLWIRARHEQPDGHGYPDGRAGDEVPEGARLPAVADAYDVITHTTIYAPAAPTQKRSRSVGGARAASSTGSPSTCSKARSQTRSTRPTTWRSICPGRLLP